MALYMPSTPVVLRFLRREMDIGKLHNDLKAAITVISPQVHLMGRIGFRRSLKFGWLGLDHATGCRIPLLPSL